MSSFLSIWDLFLFPVSLPLKFLTFLAEQIRGYLDQELSDEDGVRQQLLELRLLYEMDEIEEDEYRVKEKELRARLREIRERKLDTDAAEAAEEPEEESGEAVAEPVPEEEDLPELTMEEMIERVSRRLTAEGKLDADGKPIEPDAGPTETEGPTR